MTRRVIANSLRISAVCLFVLSLCAGLAGPAFSETITVRSGGAAIGFPDPILTFLAGPAGLPLSASPFTAADFSAALSGPSAIVVPPYGGGALWLPSLACDPLAQWVSVSAASGPASTLFACNFDVKTCCIHSATLTFCWVADDYLGDPVGGGPNPAGVYINQTATTPMIAGGAYTPESTSGPIDVTSLIHCGRNELHVYDRDAGYVVSGVMFSATLEITSCPVSTETATWSRIKALYR